MTTLGSCIAACIWDRQLRIGGMNHFMLPEGSGAGADAGRYGSYAMELLINELVKRGATRSTMEAKVFGGGAVISGMNSINVGERNTKFVLDYLSTERITVVSKDVMDVYPRKVCFLPHSGKAMVKRLAATNTDALLAQERAAAASRCQPPPRPARWTCSEQRNPWRRPASSSSTTRPSCAGCCRRSSIASRTCSASAPQPTRWSRAR